MSQVKALSVAGQGQALTFLSIMVSEEPGRETSQMHSAFNLPSKNKIIGQCVICFESSGSFPFSHFRAKREVRAMHLADLIGFLHRGMKFIAWAPATMITRTGGGSTFDGNRIQII